METSCFVGLVFFVYDWLFSPVFHWGGQGFVFEKSFCWMKKITQIYVCQMSSADLQF